MVQAELQMYVTPVVILPQEDTTDSGQNSVELVDISSDSCQNCNRSIDAKAENVVTVVSEFSEKEEIRN